MKKIHKTVVGIVCFCMMMGNTGSYVIASSGDTDLIWESETVQDGSSDEKIINEEEGSDTSVGENGIEDLTPEDENENTDESNNLDDTIESVESENSDNDISSAKNEFTDDGVETQDEIETSEEELQTENEEEIPEEIIDEEPPKIMYQVHVQNKGWMNWVTDNEIAGTTGESLRVEAVKIKLEKTNENSGQPEEISEDEVSDEQTKELAEESHVEYRVHIRNKGWQSWKKDGELAGTTGEELQIEAIQIRLIGEITKEYEVYYKSHVADFGWLGLVKGEELSGTEGMSKRVEALMIGLEKSEN